MQLNFRVSVLYILLSETAGSELKKPADPLPQEPIIQVLQAMRQTKFFQVLNASRFMFLN
jgi:hypothetical protein